MNIIRVMYLLEEKIGGGPYPRIGELSPFYQVQIETRYECNLRCPMCPNSYMDKSPFWGQEMSWKLFKKIIAELKDLDFGGRVSLYLSNEPLLDGRITEMVAHARKQLPKNRINTSTNGVLLTNKILDDLFAAGLTDIDISCYSKQILDRWRCADTPNKIKVYDFVRGSDIYYNRGGNVEVANNNKAGNGMCWRPYVQLYVASSGECVLCCSDFKRKVVMGDLNKETIEDVWNGDKYMRYREKMIDHRNELELCKDCNYAGM